LTDYPEVVMLDVRFKFGFGAELIPGAQIGLLAWDHFSVFE
jgi:hypothetical protein